MYQVYILKLENGKYFVGHTQSIENLNSQITKNHIEWLVINPYIKILKVINNCDKFDVDKYTKKYMEVYGIDNVRGGTYYQPILTTEIINQIKKEIKINENDIYAQHNSDESNSNSEDIIEDSFDKIKDEFDIINKCSRCGSNKHYAYNCYAEFVPDGQILRCKKCKEYGHIKQECPITKQQIILEQFQKLDNKIQKIINKFKS